MRSVHLDLLHPRPGPGLAAWAICLSGAVLLLAAGGWNYFAVGEIEARRSMLTRQLDAAQAAVAALRPPSLSRDGEAAGRAWGRAMRVSAELNAPWGELFQRLEREAKRPVGLLSLDIDAGRRNFLLSAEARNFDEMLAYLRLLQEGGQLSAVVLDAHQVNRQDREKPLRFRVSAHWLAAEAGRGEVPAEGEAP